LTAGVTTAADSLTIGSRAPAVDVEHWFHGKEPLAEFLPGKVYVIEFWATWCGPCLASMPHLRDLQKRHGDALVVVGVSDESPDVIEKFLERETDGTTFDEITSQYRLATDPDESVKNDYMRAAGERGIPTAFVVGKTGLIEWIGHPLRMDDAVATILADEWDREAYVRLLRDEKRVESRLRTVEQLVRRKQFSQALRLVDEILEGDPPAEVRGRIAAVRRRIEAQALDHATREASREQLSTIRSLVDMAFLLRDGDTDAAVATLEQALKACSDPKVRSVLIRAREKLAPARGDGERRPADRPAIQPWARFQFDGSAEDTGAGKARFELTNTEFIADALYLNGVYEHGGDDDGYRALCHMPEFDYRPFSVALRFKAEKFDGSNSNLLTAGTSFRWFGLSRSRDGNLVVTFNNQREHHVIPDTMLETNRWTVVACSVDPARGKVLVSVDRARPHEIELAKGFAFEVAESGSRDSDKNWGFTNYSNGTTFHGLVDELLIYDQPLSVEEIIEVPLTPEPS